MKYITLILTASICCFSTNATEIIYTPISPTFGGNPLNGSFLLSKASAQNDNSEDRSKDFVERFKESLERNIMSQITREFASGELVGGKYDSGDYKIEVVDLGNGRFQVLIHDKLNNTTTIIELIRPAFGGV